MSIEALEPRFALDAGPIISEFMALNSHTLADQDGDYSDWIEIYNPTAAPLNLGGWYLTDSAGQLTKWQFPSLTIAAGGFEVVFASDKNRAVAGSELHTNFKLSGEGDYLALVEPNGTTIASHFYPTFPPQYEEVSYGQNFGSFAATQVTVTASKDTWIRENTPTTSHENDAISVFLTDTNGPGRRNGVIEWNLSGVTQQIVGAHLELWNRDGNAVSQQAYRIPSGVTGSMTWNSYVANFKPFEVLMQSLGAGTFPAGGAGAYYSTNSASASDVAVLEQLRTTTGRFAIVLKAVSGRRDWGDIELDGRPPRLLLDFAPPPFQPGELRFFATPTPGGPNYDGVVGLVADATSSVERGFYNAPFDVVLGTTTPGATLVYTTDGSEPSLTNGTRFLPPNPTTTPQGTVHVASTTTFRVAVLKTGYLPSNINTSTYIFVSDVKSQSPSGQAPPGWPSGSVNGQVLDYGMDPQVLNGAAGSGDFDGDGDITLGDFDVQAAYWFQTVPKGTLGDMDRNSVVDLYDFGLLKAAYTMGGTVPTAPIEAALTAISSISLVTDLDNLFDPATGIYVNAALGGTAWERPISMELIHPDGSPGFQIDGGIRIRGNGSTSDANPKHSFRLFFDSSHEGPLNFPLFGSDGVDTYEKVDLRTDQDNSWSFRGSLQETFINDVFSRDTQRDMGEPYTRSEYYHLYIDGVYWGIYQTQERPSKEYGETHFGGDDDSYDVIKATGFQGGYTTEATDGNLDTWHDLWATARAGVANNADYYRLQGLNADGSTRNPAYPVLLDVDNLIDYMLVIFYTGDDDAPLSWFLQNNRPNNFFAVQNRDGDQGFQFFAFDSESTLFSDANHGGLNEDRTGPFGGSNQNNFLFSNPQWLHEDLMSNAEYRLRFADRVQEAFFGNGTLTVEATKQRFLARAAEVGPAILAESARWGDAQPSRANDPLTKADWQAAVDKIVNNYLPFRGAIVLNQLKADGLYPATAAPQFNNPGGIVLSGFNLTISAPPGTIYYTLDGSDPRLVGGGISPTALIYSGPISITQSRSVNARVKNGSAWSALTSADFQVSIPALRVTELMYHPRNPPPGGAYDPDEFEYIELKNIGVSTINLADIQLGGGIDFTFPSMNLAAGQCVVVVENVAAFNSRYEFAVNTAGQYSGKLSNSGESITLSDAFGQLIQSFAFADTWYPTTDGSGYSLVIVDAAEDTLTWNSASNWRPSTDLDGSPGVTDSAGGAGAGAGGGAELANIANEPSAVAHSAARLTDTTAAAVSTPPVVALGSVVSDQSSITTNVTTTGSAGRFLAAMPQPSNITGHRPFIAQSDITLKAVDTALRDGIVTGRRTKHSSDLRATPRLAWESPDHLKVGASCPKGIVRLEMAESRSRMPSAASFDRRLVERQGNAARSSPHDERLLAGTWRSVSRRSRSPNPEPRSISVPHRCVQAARRSKCLSNPPSRS